MFPNQYSNSDQMSNKPFINAQFAGHQTAAKRESESRSFGFFSVYSEQKTKNHIHELANNKTIKRDSVRLVNWRRLMVK